MEKRNFGRLGRDAGVIGLGAWQLGADWGEVSEEAAFATLAAAVDAGVTFLDTADVYGDGRSEQIIGRFLRQHKATGPATSDPRSAATSVDGAGGPGPSAGEASASQQRGPSLTVATKMGRRVPQEPSAYNLDAFRAWNDRSRANLGVDTLDLVQLHCPPTPVYSTDAVFDALDTLVGEKRIAAYGVSVERVDEALTAIARPGVASVQIILNALRRKPLEAVLPAAAAAGVGIIARVPLASGLLSGRYDEHTTFGADDHRNFNRHGESFDVGETFAGVPYEVGLEAVRRLKPLVPPGATMAQWALRWVADQPGVTVVIPGARGPEQARANAAAADLAPLTPEAHAAVAEVYDELIRPLVHDRW